MSQSDDRHDNQYRPRPSGRASGARRTRPVARPIRKASPPHIFPPQNDPFDDLMPIQTLSVEISPIGGIFGAPTPILDEHDERPGRIGRMLRKGPGVLIPSKTSLLSDPNFLTLWLSRLLSQTAQGALLYALLIMVVDLSDKSTFNSLFVICSIIPSIAFGIPAGLVADTMPRRAMMVTLNLFRFAFMVLAVGTEIGLAGVFATTLGIWVIHQFYSPAESSALADLVPTDRYTGAQAMFNLALTISQAMGLVIMAPLLLRWGGPRLVFAVCGILWLCAAAFAALLPALNVHRHPRRASRSLRQMFGDGWRFARSDRFTFEAIIDDVLVSVGMSALVVIMPFYLERVLGTAKENTVFVFAPAAIGLIFGIRAASRLSRFIGEQYLATLALFLFALVVAALGFVSQIHVFINGTLHLPLDRLMDAVGVNPQISVAMLLSVPAGFASALVNVAARSILLARTPGALRGQVIATQGLIGNVASLGPTILAGIATDLFGVRPIAVAIGVVIVIAALAAHMQGRRTSDVSPSLAAQA